jgi:UrcA family protein
MTRYFNAHALSLSLAAATLLASAAPAKAQPDDQSTSVRVRFTDLDISHPAGASVLLKRIERAAVTVCGGEPGSSFLGQNSAYQQCREDAISQAVRRVDAPMLTAAARRDIKPLRLVSR